MLNEQVLSTSACQYNEYQYHDTVSYRGSSVVVIRDTQNVLYRRSLLVWLCIPCSLTPLMIQGTLTKLLVVNHHTYSHP